MPGDGRLAAARALLAGTAWAGSAPVPLAGDASGRRYFRLAGAPPAVLMDAPPGSGHDVGRFAELARFLAGAGLSAPAIHAEDRRAGFLVVEDFGDAILGREVESRPNREAALYEGALDVLVALDRLPPPAGLPRPDAAAMAEAIRPAFEWYRGGGSGDGAFEAVRDGLRAHLERRRETSLSLRDFHAENLAWLPGREGARRVGLLDFQDAMAGPVGYDLASLLLDARRDVSPDVSERVAAGFARRTGRADDDVRHRLAVLGAQRNIRILGVFARLALESGKPRYLDFLPRVWRHVDSCVAHPDLSGLAGLVRRELPAPTPERMEELRARCPTAPKQ